MLEPNTERLQCFNCKLEGRASRAVYGIEGLHEIEVRLRTARINAIR